MKGRSINMALIKCPECGKEVSDKAKACIHCGYPLENVDTRTNPNMCLVNGVEYDLSFLLDDTQSKYDRFIRFENECLSNLQNPDSNYITLTGEIIRTKIVPPTLTIGEAVPKESPKIKCPTCSSTDVRKISGSERVGSVMMLGIFSKKINKSFKCNHCGYTW